MNSLKVIGRDKPKKYVDEVSYEGKKANNCNYDSKWEGKHIIE